MPPHKVFFISALLTCSIALAIRKTSRCERCTYIGNCPEAARLLQERSGEPAVQSLLQDLTCKQRPRHSFRSQKKICCSNLKHYNTILDFENHPSARLLPDDCGRLLDDYRIMGGTDARLEEFPWMVLIIYEGTGPKSAYCGGSLISARYVLTAAHCVSARTIAYVRVGEHNLDTSTDCEEESDICKSNTQDIRVAQSIVHPQYKLVKMPRGNYVIHDIALLRLTTPVTFDTNIAPVCLPITQELQNIDLTREPGVVTGWGDTGIGAASNVLLKAFIPVFSNNMCRHYYGSIKEEWFWSSAFCGGRDRVDTCKGDSGGPFTFATSYKDNFSNVQFGITSFGISVCGTKPGIYTDVRYYVKWILDKMKP